APARCCAAAVGLDFANYYVVDGRDDLPGGLPKGKQWRLDVPNNHFQYALTWFLLAGALIIMTILFLRKQKNEA
ncbi:MAG: SURF1 family cytochrome oxidase biogenesis protein, partial [Pseudomonadota bacterium]